jgi:2'-5' RNA ligase
MDRDVEERGLTIMVPEAEAFVQSFRAEYDSLNGYDIPAHITINHPFCPKKETESQLEAILADLFAAMPAFQFALTEVRRFPETLYLVPEPDANFRMLINAVSERFPESPPYEGQYEDVVPHLTVAYLEDGQAIEAMAEALEAVAAEALPIAGEVKEVLLMEKIGGVWHERRGFQLQ